MSGIALSLRTNIHRRVRCIFIDRLKLTWLYTYGSVKQIFVVDTYTQRTDIVTRGCEFECERSCVSDPRRKKARNVMVVRIPLTRLPSPGMLGLACVEISALVKNA